MALSQGKIGFLYLILGILANNRALTVYGGALPGARPASSRLDLGSAAQRESAFEQPTGPGQKKRRAVVGAPSWLSNCRGAGLFARLDCTVNFRAQPRLALLCGFGLLLLRFARMVGHDLLCFLDGLRATISV